MKFLTKEAEAKYNELMLSPRPLTRITFFKINEFDKSFKHYFDFENFEAVDDYLTSHTQISQLDYVDFSYQKIDEAIKMPAFFADVQGYNYLRIENRIIAPGASDKVWYAYIESMKEISNGLTLVTFSIDDFTTWLPFRKMAPIGSTPVERGHQDEFEGVDNLWPININAEEPSATTTLQTLYSDHLYFNGTDTDKNQDTAFAVFWMLPNFGQDNSPLPDGWENGTNNNGPNAMIAAIVPYDVSTLNVLDFKVGSTTVENNSMQLNKLNIAFNTDAGLITSVQFITSYTSEDLGFSFSRNGNTITASADQLTGTAFASSTGNYNVFIVNAISSVVKTIELDASPYELVLAQQNELLKRSGSAYVIKNVKTSIEPFARIDLVDGFGGFDSFDISYINYTKPNDKLKFWRISAMGLNNKVFTTIKDYYNMSNLADNTSEYYTLTTQKGLYQTEDKALPIVNDTFASTNALNANANKMVYTNAKLAKTENTMQNNLSKKNNNLSISSANQTLKNNQKNEKRQQDIKTGAAAVESVNDALGITMGPVGQVAGFLTQSALGIARGATTGGLTGAIAGGLTAGIQNAQENASINANQANARANQSLANKTSKKQLNNSIATSENIASMNYENTIANFNAGQADLKNAPDTLNQQAGDVYFNYSNNLWRTHFQVKGETVDRIIQTDMYFSMFGMTINRWFSEDDFMTLIRSRTRFNYIRVAWIKLIPNSDIAGVVPQSAIRNIEIALENGVTIWHDITHPYNYDLANNQVNLQLTNDTYQLLQIQQADTHYKRVVAKLNDNVKIAKTLTTQDVNM